MANKIKELASRPFDQYSRQFIVYEILKNILGVADNRQAKVIDLGGHKGITTDFLPNNDVTILDVYDENYKGYVKGDATSLTFSDQAFDVSVSFDVFEHIPREDRLKFVSEAVRVSKVGAFIAAPFNNDQDDVAIAEIAANEVYKALHGGDHEWLKEHIEYKIPKSSEMDALLEGAGLAYVAISTNDLELWMLLQTLTFAAEKDPEIYKILKEFELEFNDRIADYDAGVQHSYRKIYFISNNQKTVNKVAEYLEKRQSDNQTTDLSRFKSKLTRAVLMTFVGQLSTYQQENKELTGRLSVLQDNINMLKKEIGDVKMQVQAYEKSTSWRVTRPLRNISKNIRRKG